MPDFLNWFLLYDYFQVVEEDLTNTIDDSFTSAAADPLTSDISTYSQPSVSSIENLYESPASNFIDDDFAISESVIDLIGDNESVELEKESDDSESTLFIDIASPVDSYANKREAKASASAAYAFEPELLPSDLSVINSFKKVTEVR